LISLEGLSGLSGHSYPLSRAYAIRIKPRPDNPDNPPFNIKQLGGLLTLAQLMNQRSLVKTAPAR
jgi:hypothetical protein